jgi:N-glycosidase YbiA
MSAGPSTAAVMPLPAPEVIAQIRAAVAAKVDGAVWMTSDDPSTPPENTLWFYGHKNAFGCFSNFFHVPIVMGAHTWPTSEHYFQAMKFHDHKDHFEAVKFAKGPMEAAKMGRDRSRPLRKDWEAVKDDLMFDVVLAKFSQHQDLQEHLLSTGSQVLVEHTANDAYWGDGGDGAGRNMLGITLMQVREVLRHQIATRDMAPATAAADE